VTRLRDVLPTDTPDPIVAKAAQDADAILLTHDGDFKSVAPRIALGQRNRFRKLSKVHLNLEHARSEKRLAAAIALIEFEWLAAQARTDKRLHIVIQLAVIKTHR
jgi:predicted nuclease of predicted toxin-antitoxin system